MRDERDERLDAFFAAARRDPVDTSSREEFFETRLMARLAERKNGTAPWRRLVWRMIPGYALVAVVSAIWTFSSTPAVQEDIFAPLTNIQEKTYAQVFFGE